MLNCRAEYERMARAEPRLWWYRALHHLVLHAIAGHPAGHAARILDAGCGTGGLLAFLRARGFENLSGFDLSADAVEFCAGKGLPVRRADLAQFRGDTSPAACDVVVSNDTLYFFDADTQARILREFHRALAPEGLLILNLPALRAFRGRHDAAVGIQERFTLAQARSLVAAGGFALTRAVFWPFTLAPMIYLVRRTQRRGAAMNAPASDLDTTPAILNRPLEWLVRMENLVLRRKPFGSSLFIVARKQPRAADA